MTTKPTPPRATIKPRRILSKHPIGYVCGPLDQGWDYVTVIFNAKRAREEDMTRRVLLIDLTPGAIEALRRNIAKAFSGSYDGHLHPNDINAMLTALGITQPKAGKRGKKSIL